MAVKQSNERSIALLWKVIFLIMALIILTAIIIFLAYANFNDEQTSIQSLSGLRATVEYITLHAC